MAELAFGLAQTALQKLVSKAYEEIALTRSLSDDLKKLEGTMSTLESVLRDAEKKQNHNEKIRKWLARLQDVLNDAVDMVDEFECQELRLRVVREFGTVSRKVRRFFSGSNPLAFHFSIARRVKEVKDKFSEVTREMAQFGLISAQLNTDRIGCEEMKGRVTHSFIRDSEVIGRDDDKAAIIRMLTRQDDRCCRNLSVIPIVGLGGLGKTTLAQSVYNDESVGKMFNLRVWVCVSLDFNVPRLLRDILNSSRNAAAELGSLSLDQLQNLVRATLRGQRYLLVLDDVWNEDRIKWLELRDFLTEGAEGSKILVTTRNTTVSSKMTDTPPHQMKGLSGKDSLSLFLKSAFGDEEQPGQPLKEIGEEIVKKCGGVPLALTVLGSLLYSKRTKEDWENIRDSEIWELEEGGGRILPALRLSYDAMSSQLKQCFTYCSTYPDHVRIGVADLISIWMSLGILQSRNKKMELEDIGESVFKELCERSFFQCTYDSACETNAYGLVHYFNMHDLNNELARSISKSECSIIKTGMEDMSNSVRYLRVFLNPSNLTTVHGLKKLRSIHVCTTAENGVDESFVSRCITQLRYLRVFDLKDSSIGSLPSSIGALKHLRYLNLSGNHEIKRLPNSICKLQSLQTLLLHDCRSLEELPRDMCNLVSLRTLYVTTKQTRFPENGIGRLRSLRTLLISFCPNLVSLPQAMRHCTTLRNLSIFGCERLNMASGDEEVGIPVMSLQKLVMYCLPQTTAFPQWLRGASLSLKALIVRKCGLVELPKWLLQVSTLAHLEIDGCIQLADEADEVVMLKLQKLIIYDLGKTTFLPRWLRGASLLTVLIICGCDSLVELPKWLGELSSLAHLEMNCCKQLELAGCTCNDESVPLKLQKFIIYDLPATTALPQWLRASHTLQLLEITDCPKLTTLPKWLPDLTSLNKLVINSCPQLKEAMSRLTLLTNLEISPFSTAFYGRYVRESDEERKQLNDLIKAYRAYMHSLHC